MQNQQSRRSRFNRTKTGKRIFIVERDLEIFYWLYRYRYLRANQLVSFIKPKSEKRFIERLGDLYHETGYIDRPQAQWRDANARYRPLIYELSAAGEALLLRQGKDVQRATSLSRQKRKSTNSQFVHAMMTVDALVAVEQKCLIDTSLRFVCLDEILHRAPEKTKNAENPLAIPVTIKPNPKFPNLKSPWPTHIIPDGLYGIERVENYEKLYRFFALECERTTPKHRRSIHLSSRTRKEVAYETLLKDEVYKTHFGIPNLSMRIIE